MYFVVNDNPTHIIFSVPVSWYILKKKHMVAIGLILGMIGQWIWYPFRLFADADIRYQFMTSLLFSHTRFQMRYASIGPLLSAPLYYLDQLFRTAPYFVLRYNLILFAVATFVLYKLLVKEISKQLTLAFLAFLLVASLFPGHLIHYYGDVFSALTAAIGIFLIEKRKFPIGFLLLALSVANAPATMPALGLYILYKCIKERNIRYFVIPFMAVCFVLLDYKLRFPRTLAGFTTYLEDRGFPTILPYAGIPGFSYPLVFGLLGELFSFGKGLLFFVPGLVFIPLALKSMKTGVMKAALISWTIFAVGMALSYAKWWGWYGGWFWGPRYLLFAAIPGTFALIWTLFAAKLPKWTTILSVLLAVWSLWVGINGVVFQQKGMDICTRDNFVLEHLCWYTPEYSALFHPFVVMPKVSLTEWLFIAYASLLILIVLVPVARRFLLKRKK